jgi:hypothetical protein
VEIVVRVIALRKFGWFPMNILFVVILQSQKREQGSRTPRRNASSFTGD